MMEDRIDHYETCDCDNCIWERCERRMVRKADEDCGDFVSYSFRDQMEEELNEVIAWATAGLAIFDPRWLEPVKPMTEETAQMLIKAIDKWRDALKK